MKLILATKSPRRHQLFKKLLKDMNASVQSFEIVVPDIDETNLPGESPVDCAMRLAKEKAQNITCDQDAIILTADTIVVLDGKIYGKPVDEEDAIRMLKELSGRTHEVITGYCILSWGRGVAGPQDRRKSNIIIDHDISKVTFRELNETEIRKFIATGIPMDKAGAYAVQEDIYKFIDTIEGSYTNVMGLPTEKIQEILTPLI